MLQSLVISKVESNVLDDESHLECTMDKNSNLDDYLEYPQFIFLFDMQYIKNGWNRVSKIVYYQRMR